jgi:hypothetical protein
MTDAEICLAAGRILSKFGDELEALRKGASDLKQIAFLDCQLNALPEAMLLLGCAAGRDSLKRQMTPEQLAEFDAQQAR